MLLSPLVVFVWLGLVFFLFSPLVCSIIIIIIIIIIILLLHSIIIIGNIKYVHNFCFYFFNFHPLDFSDMGWICQQCPL